MAEIPSPISRRNLLSLIGAAAGSAVMYQAMVSLGFAEESQYKGPIKLEGDPKGASVLILGAGLAGLVAALELRKVGYKVQVLEFRDRAGGRNWTLRGGDTYTELGGFTQKVEFEGGLYFNPGPWRIPYHHHAVLDYCRRLGVALEPFVQVNYNSYLHSRHAFAGKPQRFRHIQSDFHGHIAELLSKVTKQGKLNKAVSKEDQEMLLEALQDWGALDKNFEYKVGLDISETRGYNTDPGGGLNASPIPSKPISLSDLLKSELWQHLSVGNLYEFQTPLFQPIGGMDMISQSFMREVNDLIRYNSKVKAIHQDVQGVTVNYQDTKDGTAMTATADWCLCTIPLSVLSQIDINVGSAMKAAIDAVPYDVSVKFGLQFKRRFWEQDDVIYGGISYTDLPISLIGYPNTGYGTPGRGVLLGGYCWDTYAYEVAGLPPDERVRRAVEYGAQIHPQYNQEFENGVAVAWERVPWVNGCYGMWTDEKREAHYRNLCQIDGRITLA